MAMGSLDSGRDLLERLIHDTAAVIAEQRSWFRSPTDAGRFDGVAISPPRRPSPAGQLRRLSPQRDGASPTLRRPPQRDLASPPTPRPTPPPRISARSASRSGSEGRDKRARPSSPPVSSTVTVSTATPSHSPTRAAPARRADSPQLAPPSSPPDREAPPLPPPPPQQPSLPLPSQLTALAARKGRRQVTDRSHRAADRLSWTTHKLAEARTVLQWMTHAYQMRLRQSKANGSDAAAAQRVAELEEQLRVSNADREVAQARVEAAEARVRKAASDGAARERDAVRAEIDDWRRRAAEAEAALQHRGGDAGREAEAARTEAAAAREALANSRAEVERLRRAAEQAKVSAARVEELQLQAAGTAADHRQLSTELQSLREQLAQRGGECADLRATLAREQTAGEQRLAALGGAHAADVDRALFEQRKATEMHLQRLHSELERLRQEVVEGRLLAARYEEAAADRELARARAEKLQELLGGLRSELAAAAHNEAALREQLDARSRENAVLSTDLSAARAEIARLAERADQRDRGSTRGDGSETRVARLEEQLRERSAAAAAAEAELGALRTTLARQDSDLAGRQKRIEWLDGEVARLTEENAELRAQCVRQREEKERVLGDLAAARAQLAQVEARLAAEEKRSQGLASALESCRAEAAQLRARVTELQADLAAARGRLEGREEALAALREDHAVVKAQLANAEKLLAEMARSRDRSANESDAAQREAEERRLALAEKDLLLDHLRQRLQQAEDSAAALQHKLAEAEQKLADERAAVQRLGAELASAKDAQRAAEQKAASVDALAAQLAEQQAQLSELRTSHASTAAEVDSMHTALAAREAELRDRGDEAAALAAELRVQLEISEGLAATARVHSLLSVDGDERWSRQTVAAEEATMRSSLTALQLSQAEARWCAAEEQARTVGGDHSLLSAAAAELRGVLRTQANKVAALQAMLLRQRQKEAALLQRASAARVLSRGLRRLQLSSLSRRHAATVVRRQLSRLASTELLCSRSRAANTSRRYAVWQRWLLLRQGGRFAGSACGRLRLCRAAAVRTLASANRRTCRARFVGTWLRWLRRRRRRHAVAPLLRRTEAGTRRRFWTAFLLRTVRRLREAIASGSGRLSVLRSTAHWRYHRLRSSAALVVGAASRHRLVQRYLGRWVGGWQDRRLRGMASRVKRIESMMLGNQLERRRSDEEAHLERNRLLREAASRDEDLGRWLSAERTRVLSLQQQSAGQLMVTHAAMHDTEESVGRLELQREEAVAAYDLGLVAADLRHSRLAVRLLKSELRHAFGELQSDERCGRVALAADAHLLLSTATAEQLLHERAAAEHQLAAAKAVFREQQGAVDQAERARLATDNERLVVQLEATSAQLAEARAALGGVAQERAAAEEERAAVNAQLQHAEERLSDARERLRVLEATSDGTVQASIDAEERSLILHSQLRVTAVTADDLRVELDEVGRTLRLREQQLVAAQQFGAAQQAETLRAEERLAGALRELDSARKAAGAARGDAELVRDEVMSEVRALRAASEEVALSARSAAAREAEVARDWACAEVRAARDEVQSTQRRLEEEREARARQDQAQAQRVSEEAASVQIPAADLAELSARLGFETRRADAAELRVAEVEGGRDVLMAEQDRLQAAADAEVQRAHSDASAAVLERDEALLRTQAELRHTSAVLALVSDRGRAEVAALRSRLRLFELGLDGPLSPLNTPLTDVHAHLQSLHEQHGERRCSLERLHADQTRHAEMEHASQCARLEAAHQVRLASTSFAELHGDAQERIRQEHVVALARVEADLTRRQLQREEAQRDEAGELEQELADEERHLVNIATARMRRDDLLCRHGEERWQFDQKQRRLGVDRARADREREELLVRQQQEDRALDDTLAEEERRARDALQRRRSTDLMRRHGLELREADLQWEAVQNRHETEWADYRAGSGFEQLSDAQREDVVSQHVQATTRSAAAAASQRSLILSRHQREVEALHGECDRMERGAAQMRVRRHELAAKRWQLQTEKEREWNHALASLEADWAEYTRGPAFQHLPPGHQSEQTRQHRVQVERLQRTFAVERRQLAEAHRLELAGLEEEAGPARARSPSVPRPDPTQTISPPRVGGWTSHEQLAFVLNTRGRLVAFAVDSFRSARSARRSLEQAAQLVLVLFPAAKAGRLRRLPEAGSGVPLASPLRLQQSSPSPASLSTPQRSARAAAWSSDDGTPTPRVAPPRAAAKPDETQWQRLASQQTRSQVLRMRASQSSDTAPARRPRPERASTPPASRRRPPAEQQHGGAQVDLLASVEHALSVVADQESSLHQLLLVYLTPAEQTALDVAAVVGDDTSSAMQLDEIAAQRAQLLELKCSPEVAGVVRRISKALLP